MQAISSYFDLTSYFPITNPTLIFLVVLCIILLAPIVMGRLRIPHIVGMVLAGVVIGQYGLNILVRDSSFELFGKVGVFYIMFLAGLEMNLTDIMRKRVRFIVFGLLTFLIPFILGYITGIYLLGYSTMTSLLLSCILASNTLVAYPIVLKYGLSKHSSVSLSVGSSMIALSLALLLLASVVGMNDMEGETLVAFWVLFLVRVIIYCAALVFIIPRLTRWFFGHFADSVTLYIYVMAVLFLSAAAAEFCGIEGIFGAFLTGLILNRFIPSVSPLMNRIEFIGNAIFIPYFLIGVGMLINIRVLFYSLDTLYVVFWIVLVGSLGKAIAAYATTFGFKLPLLSGHMMFGLTEAHAAGSIAMTMVGMNLRMPDGSTLVDNDMLNGIVMMILFTCIISSVVVESSARRILLREKTNPSVPERTGDDEKILICLQHEEDADSLVDIAITIHNKKLNRGLIGLNVVYDDVYGSKNRRAGQKLLEHAEAIAISADVRMQTQSRLAVNIANGIKHAFSENDASEVIMALHHRNGGDESFWGSHAQALTEGLNRQIMICRLVSPLSTLRCIHVAIPSRAELENGFYRWVERLSRLADNLGCRIVFHGREESHDLIRRYLLGRHANLRAEFVVMQHWREFPVLAQSINDDHLLVVITARPGTVSYKKVFEYLPEELTRYFSDHNLIIVYPDQNGAPQDMITFTSPQPTDSESAYHTIKNWFQKLRGKNKVIGIDSEQ